MGKRRLTTRPDNKPGSSKASRTHLRYAAGARGGTRDHAEYIRDELSCITLLPVRPLLASSRMLDRLSRSDGKVPFVLLKAGENYLEWTRPHRADVELLPSYKDQ